MIRRCYPIYIADVSSCASILVAKRRQLFICMKLNSATLCKSVEVHRLWQLLKMIEIRNKTTFQMSRHVGPVSNPGSESQWGVCPITAISQWIVYSGSFSLTYTLMGSEFLFLCSFFTSSPNSISLSDPTAPTSHKDQTSLCYKCIPIFKTYISVSQGMLLNIY